MKITFYIAVLSILLAPLTSLNADEITLCDIEAAHPSDPNHVGEGKDSVNVDTFAAIAACRQAIKKSPETARFHYQLGRSLFYQGEAVEGMTHIQHAVDMGYMQAQFVMGLLKKGQDICTAETLTKAAADQGLKSARITYVNDFVSNAYADCKLSATPEEMSEYLGKAGAQVEGYYENMLFTNLKRELNETTASQ